ncbi:hypothetical protein [Helicobacter muridarum]|uniref:hypothetical protein n=1 Tax=Helicobacter muridarum TaxID=216 RepID=UPI0011C0571A|nr:hypothetical protein [Helicobacter muridarum]
MKSILGGGGVALYDYLFIKSYPSVIWSNSYRNTCSFSGCVCHDDCVHYDCSLSGWLLCA